MAKSEEKRWSFANYWIRSESTSTGNLQSQKKNTRQEVCVHLTYKPDPLTKREQYAKITLRILVKLITVLSILQKIKLVFLGLNVKEQIPYIKSCLSTKWRLLTKKLKWWSCKPCCGFELWIKLLHPFMTNFPWYFHVYWLFPTQNNL